MHDNDQLNMSAAQSERALLFTDNRSLLGLPGEWRKTY